MWIYDGFIYKICSCFTLVDNLMTLFFLDLGSTMVEFICHRWSLYIYIYNHSQTCCQLISKHIIIEHIIFYFATYKKKTKFNKTHKYITIDIQRAYQCGVSGRVEPYQVNCTQPYLAFYKRFSQLKSMTHDNNFTIE